MERGGKRRQIGEVSGEDIYPIAEEGTGLIGIANVNAGTMALGDELVDEFGADVAGGSGDEEGHGGFSRICNFAHILKLWPCERTVYSCFLLQVVLFVGISLDILCRKAHILRI